MSLVCVHWFVIVIVSQQCTFTVPQPSVTVSPSGPIQGAMVGSPQVLVCTVSTVDGVEISSVIIDWIGPEGSYANNSRVTIDTETGGMELQMNGNPLYHNIYHSTLKFIYLMEGDEGVYTCSVTILDTITFQTAEIKSLTSKKVIIPVCMLRIWIYGM